MSIRDEIEKIENDHWNKIAALANVAEDEDDLNEIYDALNQIYDAENAGKSDYNPAGDIAPDIENNIVWEDVQTKYTRDQIEEKWNVYGTWWDVGCIFLHPSGDLVGWNDQYGKFVRYEMNVGN